jgi:hypothetical protein
MGSSRALDGRPIRVRFTWQARTHPALGAGSDDGGETWETNWIMDFTRSLEVAA